MNGLWRAPSSRERGFCSACYGLADGFRPGCNACKKRDQYRRMKEERPDVYRAYVALKSAQRAVREGAFGAGDGAVVTVMKARYRAARGLPA